ncbi:response regulator transcription factor [Solirubrobacter ginsenosidimutans]|uniref:Response regulator transcription factor n=1 Tax=Solirubrobacter ginsenosidimutans TaxID=490573 RepID=A0A9X3N229_9ACTN|nr:response regulator transcription factor [Solirubrobacter ginsenosidimutans]MDA0167049.1 response regulator transcription factor [Solirubrobacter ginsenosidimutans]
MQGFGDDPTQWRAVVADARGPARHALTSALRRAGVIVVAEAFDGTEAVELADYHEPDLVVIDMEVSRLDAIAATRRIKHANPGVVVILLTRGESDDLGVLGLQVGAAGCLQSDLPPMSMARAIVGALRGEAAIPRRMAMRLVEQLRAETASGEHLRPVGGPLTARQWQVLDLVCEGRSTEEIARTLSVSPETVRSHVKGVFRRLNVRSREEAAAAACRLRGLAP